MLVYIYIFFFLSHNKVQLLLSTVKSASSAFFFKRNMSYRFQDVYFLFCTPVFSTLDNFFKERLEGNTVVIRVTVCGVSVPK